MARSHDRPSIEDFRAFVTFADEGEVQLAAKKLGVQQPSVSRCLSVFKDADAWLRTRGNSTDLTERGHAVLPAVRRLLRQYDQLREFSLGKRDTTAVLWVAVGGSSSQFYLPAAIARMKLQADDLEILTTVTRGEDRIKGVSRGRFDLAILSHDPLQIATTASGLQADELARQPLCVIARKGSSEAEDLRKVLKGQDVPRDLLTKWTLVGLDHSSGVRRQVERCFASSSLQLKFGTQAGGWIGIKEFAKHGLGVGLYPLSMLVREDSDAFEIRRLPAEFAVTYFVITRKGDHNSYVEAMKNELLASATAHQQEVLRRWQSVF